MLDFLLPTTQRGCGNVQVLYFSLFKSLFKSLFSAVFIISLSFSSHHGDFYEIPGSRGQFALKASTMGRDYWAVGNYSDADVKFNRTSSDIGTSSQVPERRSTPCLCLLISRHVSCTLTPLAVRLRCILCQQDLLRPGARAADPLGLGLGGACRGGPRTTLRLGVSAESPPKCHAS